MSIIGAEAIAAKPPAPGDFFQDVPLEDFGGLCSEMVPGDLPQGASPFCQDMDFELGSAFTRAGLTALFAGQITGSVNYFKTFTLPTGNKQTLVLDSAGNFYYEDVTNNPGTLVLISKVLSGCFAHSVTQFGREYIAFNNRSTGLDIPRQWDGTYFDRVSQNGPGAPPNVTSTSIELPITSITQPAAQHLHGIFAGGGVVMWSSGPGVKSRGNLVTIYYQLSATGPIDTNLSVGAYVFLANFNTVGGLSPNTAGINGTGLYQIYSIQDVAGGPGGTWHTFTVVANTTTFQYYDSIGTATYQRTVAMLTLTNPSSTIVPGGTIAITGASVPAWDIGWTILTEPSTSVMSITNTALLADEATYTYVLQTDPITMAPYANPSIGQLLTVVNSSNGGGIFNVVNVPITSVTPAGGGGTLTINLVNPDVASAPDVGTITVAGTVFTIDPAQNSATMASPILGNSTGGFAAGQGTMAEGTRKCVAMFKTRQGALTKCSQPVTFQLSNSAQAITVSGLPIGPPNTVARVLAFTGANGDYYFYIPLAVTETVLGVTTTSSSTVVNDNITTTVTLNFTDAVLLNSLSIDQQGGDQFALETLGPCLGVNTFSSRMAWWGELSAIQNLWNMSFDGGFDPTNTYPLGWTLDPTSGVNGQGTTQAVWGFGYQVTGDGTTALLGMIAQTASVDWLNVPILNPNTSYSARGRFFVTGVPSQGNAVIELFSPSQGTLGSLVIPVGSMGSGASVFSLNSGLVGTTPSIVPADLVLRYYVSGTLTNGATIIADELALYPTEQPFRTAEVRMSYNTPILGPAPEAFDGVTGLIGVTVFGNKLVTSTSTDLRDNFYIFADPGIVSTDDNGITEPDEWTLNTISRTVGTPSVDGLAGGEEWILIADRKGFYIFNGQEPIRISQEIQPNWSVLTGSHANAIWVVNDVESRHVYIGFPINGASVPNQVYMMAYTDLNSSFEIAEQKPLHISYSGRMVSWDMSRKWCPWNVYANCGALIDRQDGSTQTWFGNNTGTGKVYWLDENATSDDGVSIIDLYFTFFFINRDMEQQMQMGAHRKGYDYMTMFVQGAGTIFTTTYADSITSPRSKALANRTLSANPGNDTEIGILYVADRLAFALQTAAVGAYFQISKMTVRMRQEPYTLVRGIGNG